GGDDGQEGLELLFHGLEGNALVGLDVAHDAAGILLREETLLDGGVEVDVEGHGQAQDHQDQRPAAQGPGEALVVAAHQALEHAAGPARPAAGFALPFGEGAQQVGGHGRGGGQGHHHGDQDGGGEGDRELPEQAADDAPHQQHRDEHRHQGEADGYDGEADLPRPEESGFHGRLVGLDVADDVLQHHDGVIDHEAGGDGDGHQRQVV